MSIHLILACKTINTNSKLNGDANCFKNSSHAIAFPTSPGGYDNFGAHGSVFEIIITQLENDLTDSRNKIEIECNLKSGYLDDLNERRNQGLSENESKSNQLKWVAIYICLHKDLYDDFIKKCKLNKYLLIRFDELKNKDKIKLYDPSFTFMEDGSEKTFTDAKEYSFKNALQIDAGKHNDRYNSVTRKITDEMAMAFAAEEYSFKFIYQGMMEAVRAIDACRNTILYWHKSELAQKTLAVIERGLLSSEVFHTYPDKTQILNKYNNFLPELECGHLLAWGEDAYYKFKYGEGDNEKNNYSHHPRLNGEFPLSQITDDHSDVISRSEFLTAGLLKIVFMQALFYHNRSSSVYAELNKFIGFPKLIGSSKLNDVNIKKQLLEIGKFAFFEPLKIALLLAFFYVISYSNWELSILLTTLSYGFLVARAVFNKIYLLNFEIKVKDRDGLIHNYYGTIIDSLQHARVDWELIEMLVEKLWALDVVTPHGIRNLIRRHMRFAQNK